MFKGIQSFWYAGGCSLTVVDRAEELFAAMSEDKFYYLRRAWKSVNLIRGSEMGSELTASHSPEWKSGVGGVPKALH